MNKAGAFLILLLLGQVTLADVLCRLTSDGGLQFANYDVLSPAPNDSLLNITVTCDGTRVAQNVVLSVRLGPGMYGASPNDRRMVRATGGTDSLRYGLYRDVSRSTAWGHTDGIDTVSRSVTVPSNRTASVTFTVFARIPAQQNVAVGNYYDSVQVTLIP